MRNGFYNFLVDAEIPYVFAVPFGEFCWKNNCCTTVTVLAFSIFDMLLMKICDY